jgi:hypothetical protein
MESAIRANAEFVRTIAMEKMDVCLKFNEDGVVWLDGYINRQRKSASDDVKANLPNTLGSFFGQCILHTYGGQWELDEETGDWTVKLNERLSLFPFNKVAKQLANEDGDSVLGLFTSIGPLLLQLESSTISVKSDQITVKRSWWKLW